MSLMQRSRLLLAAAVVLAAVAAWRLGARHAARQAPAVPPAWAGLFHVIDPGFAPGVTSAAAGAALSQTRCGVCHLRPEPAVLPVASWLEVFDHHTRIVGTNRDPSATNLSWPAASLRSYRIAGRELAEVAFFYLSAAPVSATAAAAPAPATAPAPFAVRAAVPLNAGAPAMYTLAFIAEEPARIVLGNVAERVLEVRGGDGRERFRVPVPGVVTGLLARPDRYLVTVIGLDPYSSNDDAGQVAWLPRDVFDKPSGALASTLLRNLRRPVHTTAADLDGDGQDELLVEEFGFSDGSLGYYKPDAFGGFMHTTLVDLSGALAARAGDFDGDGKTDVIALFAQATESVLALWGRGGGSFEQQLLVRHHPAYGSNGLLVEDLDGDHAADLVLVNGDSMDLPSKPLLRDAGVHVLANGGAGRFTEKYFYPLAGAVQAVARDFDGDGDLDVAAISATPDFARRPVETFVYLENRGAFAFAPRRLPAAQEGCWAAIGAGDVDGDGRPDLVLGAAYLPAFGAEIDAAFRGVERRSVLVLTNTAPRRAK
jgi:hypothetical protein